jgi:hydrogenase maturation factor
MKSRRSIAIGDDIVVTKSLGLEACAILALDYASCLQGVISDQILQRAATFLDLISVGTESRIAAMNGFSAMHDITEGGLIGALYEMSIAAGLGFELYSDDIPIFADVREICQVMNIDPLRLLSSGSLIIVSSRGKEMVEVLLKAGVNAEVVGQFTKDESYLLNGKAIDNMPPYGDELWRLIERIEKS